jgi:hypothetical protein
VRTLLRLLAGGCLGLSACGAHVAAEKAKETTMAQDISLKDPFEGVFPPAWKVGDHWRATMKTEYDGQPIAAKWTGPIFQEFDFDFRVSEVPANDDGVFLIDIENKPLRLHYVGKYRNKPFSFVRLEDQLGYGISNTPDETNPPIPYMGRSWGKFVKVFPALPWPPRLGHTPFVFNKVFATQVIERTADGLRFTLETQYERFVITWKRGAPWWSSMEQTVLSPPGFPPQEVYGSGGLIDP